MIAAAGFPIHVVTKRGSNIQQAALLSVIDQRACLDQVTLEGRVPSHPDDENGRTPPLAAERQVTGA